MADVIAGKASNDSLGAMEDKTQIYGLKGNDTLGNNGKSDVLLIGGSGDDVLIMTGGNGTLSGGKGADTFNLSYSADKKVSAVIEDIDPTNDKVVITYDGNDTPKFSYKISGEDVIWTDEQGNFNLTLKGSSDASDYYDGDAHEYIWDVLKLTNQEREDNGLAPLTLSEGLMDSSSIRATEIVEVPTHTRPNGSSCFTAIKKSYTRTGENIAGGEKYSLPEEVVAAWMGSTGHRANILNKNFIKLGVGYHYDSDSKFKAHWVQMFGAKLSSPDTLSTKKILQTPMTLVKDTISDDSTSKTDTVLDADNTNIKHGGTYTIAAGFSGTIRINTPDPVTIVGNDTFADVHIAVYSDTTDLTIKDLNIANTSGGVITFGSGAANKLTLVGANTLKTADTWAAVVNVGGGLTIDGTGSLNVTAGAQGSGIGYRSGGKSSANITINGGTITAEASLGAGIGSGSSGSVGNISINGGTLEANSEKGAAIGSGYKGSVGNISIGGNAKVTASSEFGAGVGKGCNSTGAGDVTFSGNSTVLVTQININTKTLNFSRETKFVINGTTYTDKQLLFENGAKKDLNEQIIVEKAVKNGTDASEYIFAESNSWYNSLTVNAGKGDDTIDAAGADILIYGGEGNDSVDVSGLGWYKNVVAGYVTVDGGAGNDTLWIGANMGSVDDYYSSINGGAGDDSIRVNGNYCTIEGGDGNDNIVIDGKSAVDGGAGNDTIYTSEDSTISGGKGDDLIKNESSSRYYTDSDGDFLRWAENEAVTYKYTAGDGNDTIENYVGKNTIQISGGSYTESIVGEDVIIKVGNGSITLKDAKDETINIVGTEETDWKLNGTTATYGNLVTVSGVKSVDGLKLDDKVVTVSKAALGTSKVTVSNGYTLKLGSDVTEPSMTETWSFKNSTATYNQTTTAGYTLANNAITYSKKSAKTLATVKGVKSASGLTIDGKVVTVSKAALGTSKVTISNGYTLKLGSDVTEPSTTETWSFKNSTATYNQTTTAGYTLANNAITYAEKSTKTLATVKGVKSASGLTVDGKVVTVSKAALGTSKVTVSNGYTLKLGSDVTKSATTKTWSFKNSTATYNQIITEGYTLANNAITYTKKSTKTLATVKGVKSTDGLKLDGKVVTISKASLGTSKVTISNGYTLKLGSDVTKSATTKTWGLKNSTATYNQTTTAGYKLANNAITYAKKSAKTLATVKGVKSASGLTVDGKVVTVSKAALNAKKVSVSGGYEFDFAAGDYKKTFITGSTGKDTIASHGKNLSIDGGAGADKLYGGTGNNSLWGGAGNDTLYSGSGAEKFIYGAGDGKDVIFGFDDKDTLTLDNLDFAASYSKKNQAVTFKVAGGSVTLKDFTATTFHVNNDVYKISGSKLVK
ncbi:MAG: hypothetical protein IKN16_06355 [Selenomonadaceae bacterium]|nr:hypothetical protein [Selenomonadaceae bacterium]